VPQPVRRDAAERARHGVVYFGSTSVAMNEALAALAADGLHVDALRVRAFPFHDEVADFVARHESVFVVEQNRDAQLKMLMVNECGIDPARLTSVLHYDGTPITARFIREEIALAAGVARPVPLKRSA
jgi:2-oxoglutarate ferredoxin oxidoreductase subunit alpha